MLTALLGAVFKRVCPDGGVGHGGLGGGFVGKYFRIILSRTPWRALACTDGIKVGAEGGGKGRGIHYSIAILKTLTATFHLIFSDFCLLCVGGVQSHIAIRRVGEYPVFGCLVYI